MDIQESLQRVLQQKQDVTRRFFSVALGGQNEAFFLLTGNRAEQPLSIYAQFTQDLLQTLAEFHGSDWNAELREQWQIAIERVGQAIFGG